MTELNEEELKKLGAYFTELHVKPDLTLSADFKAWMESQGETIKQRSPDARTQKEILIDRVPRLPNFWGSTEHKDAVQYELWKYEVDCLITEGLYTKEVVAEEMR